MGRISKNQELEKWIKGAEVFIFKVTLKQVIAGRIDSFQVAVLGRTEKDGIERILRQETFGQIETIELVNYANRVYIS